MFVEKFIQGAFVTIGDFLSLPGGYTRVSETARLDAENEIRMKSYLPLAVALAFSVGGCKSASISKDLTSGQIGCSPHEISISNETARISGTHTWTATCHGKQYVCNYHSTTGSKCTAKQEG